MRQSFTQGHPDHDACGTGLIAQAGGPASHEVVDRALVALLRLAHRGGTDADGASGDGAGLMTAIPERFLRDAAAKEGITLPAVFGVGMVFLPANDQVPARKEIAKLAAGQNLRLLGWREVPVNPAVLGARSSETLPSIWQCFFADDSVAGESIARESIVRESVVHDGDAAFEQELFLLRKRAEAEMGGSVYFCSLSSRTIVYKGLLAPWQLSLFYPELDSPEFESQFAIFHQRFSTNTRPSWNLAQPFRYLAHNGEINTVVGNRRWLLARERELRERLQAGEWFRCMEANVSDSASLDNALELLAKQGIDVERGMLTLIPPVFETNRNLGDSAREFLEAAAAEYEPWDGPAALVFSDGRVAGAKLDRNGLRPLRFTRTADGLLVVGSEVGIADFEGKEIVERGRLGPGEMLSVELATGKLLRGTELLQTTAKRSLGAVPSKPIRISADAITPTNTTTTEDLKQRAAAFGWSEDQFRILFTPLADGKEAVWSMGDDAPPAFMSAMRRTLWDYCKQRFAQVTNPPIDPLREKHVMSLETRTGRFILESPLLDEKGLGRLCGEFAIVHKIDITFDAALGVEGASACIDRICEESRLLAGSGERLVLLSDRGANRERAALPVLLAAAAVWNELARSGNYRVPMVVESGQVIDSHHTALLLAVGTTLLHPFLALQLAEQCKEGGAARYCRAIEGGLRKVLSRMGISTLSSYRNGQLFEVVGLDASIAGRFFESASRVAEAKSLENVLDDHLQLHTVAFDSWTGDLKDAGFYRFRKQGERHGASPELMRKLHAHVETPTALSYRELEDVGWNREPVAVRDLLEIAPRPPLDRNLVEGEDEILRRFSTQAMSLGAISPEAHQALAIAMNRLGARSNTGEGGEDPALYSVQPEAANKVKQIASGRFGVTAQYLVNGEEIEIKMAQGSKPGEGGQLPASKVSPYIARLRHAAPGMALISPPPHHDIYSIEDLAQLIHDLREVNPRARIGVKLVSGAGVGIIAAGVAKAGADVITISGHDGGTGASPLSSIKNTGLPWEFGLSDAHQTLVSAGLRRQVRLRVDGGLKIARDILIASLLGADEFGFGTAALLAIGCVMARQCHLNTCPVGIATQDEKLRARFSGNPEMVEAYFRGVASEVRAMLGALLGARSLDDVVGRTELLVPRKSSDAAWIEDWIEGLPAQDQDKGQKKDKRPEKGKGGEGTPLHNPGSLQRRLITAIDAATVESGVDPYAGQFSIGNADRSIGANLSGEILRRAAMSVQSVSADFDFAGTAGQSFGAFLVQGISFRLSGEANDYVGKGLSGGTIAITNGKESSLRGDVLAGNTLLYGATSGELYLAGRAGERFAVRNSGALAVVEGVGEHGCEYMTGGVVVVLGPTGINLGSGMTGGLLYVLVESLLAGAYHHEFVKTMSISIDEEAGLRRVLRKHQRMTGSPCAERLLASHESLPLVRLQPIELPCSIEQTWTPILERLQEHAPEIPSGIEALGRNAATAEIST